MRIIRTCGYSPPRRVLGENPSRSCLGESCELQIKGGEEEMVLINNTKGKIRIRKEVSKGGLLQEDIALAPGEESKGLTREQINSINTYIGTFKLTVKEGDKEKTFESPKPRKPKKNVPIIPGQEVVEEELREEPVVEGFVSSFAKEDLDGKTAAELRSLCRQHGLLVSGTRETLIKRLLQGDSE